ncbi:MAG TPA: hypothetical protein VFJ91_09675 [Gaiellaceae bacterium]|nr:hypothetical protein [Gaiellaceae bacterium]
MSAADDLQRTAWELRSPFLEWCAELARRNDSAEWWASPLAARSPYDRFFERVCKLALGQETPPPPVPDARGPGLLRRAVARFGANDLDPRHRRRVLERHGLGAPRPFAGDALLVTWVDARSFAADGSYRDPHLGRLAALLRDRGLEVAFLARVLPSFPFADAVARLAASGETFLFPDAYLTLDDHRACAARANAFAPELDEGPVAGAAALAREQVASGRSAQAAALAYEPLARRLAEAGVRPERIVHTYEGHPWELSLARAVRAHLPGARLVGYENLNMPRLALSMFPGPGEPRPLPHRLVTNGPAYAEVLLADGWPRDVVRVGCGLRHEELWRRPPSRGPRTGAVVAATEIDPLRAAELAAKAVAAFGDDVAVKAHPLVPRDALPAGVRLDERPLDELLAGADVLLHTTSAVAYEALALGVPPVFVRGDSSLDLDPLEFAPDLHWTARTPDELRAAAAGIARLDLDVWRPRAREAAERAIAPPADECVGAFL